MSVNYGAPNPELTKAIRKVSGINTAYVEFNEHALEEMDDDGFDHDDVLTCLRKGVAHGPEIQKNQLRANVVHRGLHIRVVVGGLDEVGEDWSRLQRVKVITVMRAA